MDPSSRLTVEIARSTAELDKLEAPWDELVQAIPDCSLSQTFRYSRVAWSTIAEPRGDRLAVLSVWRADELMLVWPLHIQSRWSRTLVRNLGNTSAQEYDGPAVRPGGHAEEALAAAVAEAARLGDLLAVYQFPGDSLPVRSRLRRALTYTNSKKSPVARRPDGGDFDTWLKGRPQKLRWEMRRNVKRLEGVGTLRFDTSDSDPAFGHDAIDWIFARKREWLARRQLTAPWISDGSGERFFHELLAQTRSDTTLRLLVVGLTLDDELVSASVCYRSGRTLEGFIMAFDESRSSLGPGNVLMQECVRLAFDLGLDFDFRVNPYGYKLRLADDMATYCTQYVPCTAIGLPSVAWRHARRTYGGLKRRAHRELKRTAKPLDIPLPDVRPQTAGGKP
jgi:CelD/BcsL family acetyltransferase involved in cellulose biosynthesis